MRRSELEDARETCTIKRTTTTRDCGERRKSIRDATNEKIDQEHELRRIERDQYKKGRMTAAENDSLAEMSIDPGDLDVWRDVRQRFSYDSPPDHRAELFGEWLEEHPSESVRKLAEMADAINWDARAAEYYAEEIPF